MNPACTRVTQTVCYAAAVTDHIQTRILCLKVFVQIHFHIVEFHFYAVQQGIVVRRAWGDFVQGLDHLNDAVQNPLGNHQTQISGCS